MAFWHKNTLTADRSISIIRDSLSSPIAQSVEQRTVNPCVPGSSPGRGAKEYKGLPTIGSPFSFQSVTAPQVPYAPFRHTPMLAITTTAQQSETVGVIKRVQIKGFAGHAGCRNGQGITVYQHTQQQSRFTYLLCIRPST